ncbi:MAG: hypothetical protein NTY45_10470 [Elusimicrobia bacterium]|nr:hypothetical protein [Elusimicrobiota bacterium]
MNKIILTTFSAAMLFAPAAVRAQDDKGKMSREQAEHFAKTITEFSVNGVVRPSLNKVMDNASACAWALWDLTNDLSARLKAGKEPEPDAEFVETNIRLRMRNDYGKLCSKFAGNCKEYPGDAEFAKATQYASKDIRAYVAGFKTAQNFAKKPHRGKIENFLESARERAMFSLMMTHNTSIQATPPTPEEARYLQLALEKKQGDKFSFPPWP